MAFQVRVKKLMSRPIAGIAAFALAAGLSPTASARVSREAPIQMVLRQLVDYHISDGRLRYDDKIDLEFIEEDMVRAYAKYDGTKVSLAVFRALLEVMSTDEALIVVCHELGHALGDLPHGNFPNSPRSAGGLNPMSLEGEADYFAGKCAVDYYVHFEGLDRNAAQEKTFFAAHNMFTVLYNRNIEAAKAEGVRFNGVNLVYPDPNCRTLSVWAGAEGLPRPSCWYNP